MSENNQRQPELDYLRGIACLMVLLFHFLYRGPQAGWTGVARYEWAEPVARYGHLGVQLFFMISGYVIYKSAAGRTMKAFVVARFWRLYPAYWTGILVTTAIVTAFHSTLFAVSLRDWLWNFTMFQGWARAEDVDGAYWSLLVEMVFYIHVAIAIATGLIARTYLLVSLALMVAAVNLRLDSYWVDVLLLGRWGPYFVIGIVAYKLRAGARPLVPLLFALAALGLAFARVQMEALRRGASADWVEMAAIVSLAALFLAVVSRNRVASGSFWSQSFGNLTYPVYLVHQNAGYVLLGAMAGTLGSMASLGATMGIVFLMGAAINQIVEQRLTPRLRKRLKG